MIIKISNIVVLINLGILLHLASSTTAVEMDQSNINMAPEVSFCSDLDFEKIKDYT